MCVLDDLSGCYNLYAMFCAPFDLINYNNNKVLLRVRDISLQGRNLGLNIGGCKLILPDKRAGLKMPRPH